MCLAERAAVDGEVLAEDVNGPAMDLPVARYDPVAVRAVLVETEVVGLMAHEHPDLFEGAFVEEDVEAFSRRELAFLMLLFNAGLAAAEQRLHAPLFQICKRPVFVSHSDVKGCEGYGVVRLMLSTTNSKRCA